MTKDQLSALKESGKILMCSFDRRQLRWVDASQVTEYKEHGYQDLSHLSDAALINIGVLEAA